MCIHTYIHTYTHTLTHPHSHAHTHTHTHTHMRTHTHTHTHTLTPTFACTHSHTLTPTCARTHTHTHTLSCARTHSHTLTHPLPVLPVQVCDLHAGLCERRPHQVPSLHAHLPPGLHRHLAAALTHLSHLHGAGGRRAAVLLPDRLTPPSPGGCESASPPGLRVRPPPGLRINKHFRKMEACWTGTAILERGGDREWACLHTMPNPIYGVGVSPHNATP